MSEAEDITVDILRQANQEGIQVIATIAVAFECPFDGPTDPAIVQRTVGKFLQSEASQVVLADTIGAADPQQVRDLTSKLIKSHGSERLGCHFHGTRTMGLANVYAALQSGIRHFDSSIGGLGGCPFAPGASGNVATEDVVMMLEQMGFDTGIDIPLLLEASDLAQSLTGAVSGGRSKVWLQTHLQKQAL